MDIGASNVQAHNSGRCTSKKKSRSVFNVDVDAGVMSLFFTPPYPTIRD
jgi:hypothetical protein